METKEAKQEPSTSQNNVRSSKSRSKSAGRFNKGTGEPVYTKEQYELVSRLV